jgi:hypothetical protein
MQEPHPMHNSWFNLTLSPDPSMQYFTGHTEMHIWQLTHLSSNTRMTGLMVVFMEIDLGCLLLAWLNGRRDRNNYHTPFGASAQ